MDDARFSVSQFNQIVNTTLTSAIGEVIVEGEITQLNVTTKGGVNIVIKDQEEAAILNVSGYSPRIEGLKLVEQGMKVAAYGTPNLWSAGGRFSLQIYKILPLGEGALKEAYEKLKKELEASGLFAPERKRPLPDYVQKIALLTGKDSAAQSDFLKILKENRAGIEIDFYPVQVQGKYAEQEILNTLININDIDYDCIVLVRGGGSLEDLITFNSEKIAKMIFAMKVPVVVGVGHEKDESIADFVADIRASTPSQAAYYLVVNNENFIKSQEMKLDIIEKALKDKLVENKLIIESKAANISQRLLMFLQKIDNKVGKLEYLYKRFPLYLEKIILKIENLEKLFLSYNPRNVLKKGYAYITDESGKVLTAKAGLEIGQNINVNLESARLLTNILKITKNK